ncbi:hypothetical protein ACOME3_004890 [Neoechinorhynchus agilis]
MNWKGLKMTKKTNISKILTLTISFDVSVQQLSVIESWTFQQSGELLKMTPKCRVNLELECRVMKCLDFQYNIDDRYDRERARFSSETRTKHEKRIKRIKERNTVIVDDDNQDA